ncbi:MAG: Flp pilus assembly protein CpaB [Anaerolineae bacterium]|nr:Flp pilus assembly protein CpaB [Anaerolineae bacterium]
MKRRSWLWFIVAAILAIAAGVLAIVILSQVDDTGQEGPAQQQPQRLVVVARVPIAADTFIRTDYVTLVERDEIPSGAATEVSAVDGALTLQNIAQGEVIRMQDIQVISDTTRVRISIGDDRLAVVLPANDVLSQWGAVLRGDHVDVLFSLDVILETPMYPEQLILLGQEEAIHNVERDQSFDHASVLALQNLEVLEILREPQSPQEAEAAEEGQAAPRRTALLLKVDPQDAVVLKYLRDSVATIDLALRKADNEALFNVQPVNINYLMLRYGIVLPQPLE